MRHLGRHHVPTVTLAHVARRANHAELEILEVAVLHRLRGRNAGGRLPLQKTIQELEARTANKLEHLRGPRSPNGGLESLRIHREGGQARSLRSAELLHQGLQVRQSVLVPHVKVDVRHLCKHKAAAPHIGRGSELRVAVQELRRPPRQSYQTDVFPTLVAQPGVAASLVLDVAHSTDGSLRPSDQLPPTLRPRIDEPDFQLGIIRKPLAWLPSAPGSSQGLVR